jgi:hypothetical protein
MLLVAVVFMFGMVMPAAADTSFYGQVWFLTYIQDTESADDGDPATPQRTDDELIWNMDEGSSRFGARFGGDVVSANVEIRPLGGSQMRHWNATWNLGGGKSLFFGQGWSPMFLPSDAKIKCSAYGEMADEVRNQYIQFKMPAGPAKIMISAVKPRTPVTFSNVVVSGTTYQYTDVDVSMPKMILSASIPVGPVTIDPFYGFNNYDLEDTATQKSVSVDSSAYGVRAIAQFGPATVRFGYFEATNYSVFASISSPDIGPSYDGTTMYDSDYTGMHASVTFKVNDMIKLQAGYGTGASERTINAVTTEYERTSTYINAPITLAKGVTVDVFYEIDDYGDVSITGVTPDVAQGERTYTGARWILRF